MSYYLKNSLRYWRKTFKMMFRYDKLEWSEIIVDDLFDRLNQESSPKPIILDVSTVKEYKSGHISGARSIAITDIKTYLDMLLPFKEREIITICPGGGLSLVAVDLLVEADFQDVKSLRGGMDLWREKGYPVTKADQFIYSLKNRQSKSRTDRDIIEVSKEEIHATVDARHEECPVPILKSRKALRALEIGQVLQILTTDSGSQVDIPNWARASGQNLLLTEERGAEGYRFLVKRVK